MQIFWARGPKGALVTETFGGLKSINRWWPCLTCERGGI